MTFLEVITIFKEEMENQISVNDEFKKYFEKDVPFLFLLAVLGAVLYILNLGRDIIPIICFGLSGSSVFFALFKAIVYRLTGVRLPDKIITFSGDNSDAMEINSSTGMGISGDGTGGIDMGGNLVGDARFADSDSD